jgi:hypothetical protein
LNNKRHRDIQSQSIKSVEFPFKLFKGNICNGCYSDQVYLSTPLIICHLQSESLHGLTWAEANKNSNLHEMVWVLYPSSFRIHRCCNWGSIDRFTFVAKQYQCKNSITNWSYMHLLTFCKRKAWTCNHWCNPRSCLHEQNQSRCAIAAQMSKIVKKARCFTKNQPTNNVGIC